MANAMRILFVSGEVAPFTNHSEMAQLVRTLPEQLYESNGYEARIMMPRYGIISERRNRLHEVIRLSGTDIPVGDGTENLKVKVASIPGIRLQVYFMDNNHLFKRKGIFAGRDGKHFPDNAERALFFGRAVLETIRKLGWKPDLVHAFGWMSGLVPMLLRTEYAADTLFEETKSVFTPDVVDFHASFSPEMVAALNLPQDDRVLGQQPVDIGRAYADTVLYPPFLEPDTEGADQMAQDSEAMVEQVSMLYDQLSGVPA
jgi:starch synthase